MRDVTDINLKRIKDKYPNTGSIAYLMKYYEFDSIGEFIDQKCRVPFWDFGFFGTLLGSHSITFLLTAIVEELGSRDSVSLSIPHHWLSSESQSSGIPPPVKIYHGLELRVDEVYLWYQSRYLDRPNSIEIFGGRLFYFNLPKRGRGKHPKSPVEPGQTLDIVVA